MSRRLSPLRLDAENTGSCSPSLFKPRIRDLACLVLIEFVAGAAMGRPWRRW